ncbi:hypothetical protein N9Y92_03100 [Chlamydiales bacterium]|nr:hypothetical protein [Chlamydiales bacterium]
MLSYNKHPFLLLFFLIPHLLCALHEGESQELYRQAISFWEQSNKGIERLNQIQDQGNNEYLSVLKDTLFKL